ncbi:FadR/GntR family transcriptional regulator [Agarilytica rhodophyticola]|uniref:FadR/GntR family transcriptional regulator n=1 Tax=Agarilytica rhodophyticola TaxID=1737490 RepID=UPI000B34A08B|nr:FadR/GntR family transcriptional regulator [Agarilytica rhodophyticola]
MNRERTQGSQRLYRQIANKMLETLDSGEYPPGSRLPSERELAERYGVSRPTVREAIIALEINGRVEVKTGSGVYVLSRISAQDFERNISAFELTETRVLVEGEAAALAASMITEEQLQALDDALEEMKVENSEGNLTSDVADRKFHSIISGATQNRALISTIAHLWDMQKSLPDIHMAHNSVCKTDARQRLAEHKEIYDALLKRDPQMARVAMRNHFSRLMEALHEATDARAVEEIQRKVNERRKRFSLNRLNENLVDDVST